MGSKEWEILQKILEISKITKSDKMLGAITVEIVKEELKKEGFQISNRDVFIKGIPNELDLLVLRDKEEPICNLIYSPEQILAVLELKFRGMYGKEAILNTKDTFDSITALDNRIKCLYVCISEKINYKHRVTKENLGYEVFELLTRNKDLKEALKENEIYPTGDWKRLVDRLSQL